MTNKKQQQRTKGNVKPSSSGRSSQLLLEAGVTNIGAFSFSSSVAAAAMTENAVSVDESAVDPEIRAVFNQLSKKDSTTKLKALQKLHDICSDELRADDMKTALPFWARHFLRLATDNDRRVRECVQIAHQGVVDIVGKNLSKIFKTIAGVWFVSQSDPYAPAATSALLAFQTAFPEHKELDAIVYSQKQILEYIQDLLLVQTEKTLTDNKNASKEDMEQRYERLIVAALSAYSSLLERLSSEQVEKCMQQHKAVFQDPKFWKILKHQSPKIQHAWFTLISALCQHVPTLANQFGAKMVPSVFLNIDAEDPTVLPAVWTCALSVIKHIDDCWSHIIIQKVGILGKLKKLAKEGAHGCAMSVMPSFVVFIGRMPLETLPSEQMALTEFCSSIRESFGLNRVRLSPSEVGALVSALVDITHVAIGRNCANEEFCATMTKELFSVIRDSICEKPGFLASSPLTYSLAEKVELWHGNPEKFSHVAELFWNLVKELTQNILNANILGPGNSPETSSDLTAKYVIDRMADFLCTLHSPDKYKRRRSSGRVRFKTSSGSRQPPQSLTDHKHGYDAALEKIVAETCETCVSFSKEHRSEDMVRFLSLILRDFASETLFEEIYNQSDGTVMFLKNFCLPILKESHADGELLFLNVLFVLPEERRLDVLNKIVETESSTTVLLIVKTILDGHQSDTSVDRWLSSEKVSELLLNVARSVAKSPSDIQLSDEEKWNLLRGTLTSPERGGCVLDLTVVSKILDIFTECLADVQNLQDSTFLLEFLRSAAAAIEPNVPFWSSLETADSFLTALLRIACNPQYSIDAFVKGQVLSIWSFSLEKADETRCRNAISVMHDIVVSRKWNIAELDDIGGSFDFIVSSLVDNWEVEEADCHAKCVLRKARTLFEAIFPPSGFGKASDVTDSCFLKQAICGILTISSMPEIETSVISAQEAYISALLLKKYSKLEPKEAPPATREEILKTRFVSDSDDDNEEESVEPAKEPEKYDLEHFEYVFQSLLLAHAYLELSYDQYMNTSQKIIDFEFVSALRSALKGDIVQLFTNIDQVQQRRILAYTLNDSRIHGFLNTVALDQILSIIEGIESLEVSIKELVDLVEIESVGDLHTYEMLVSKCAKKFAKDILFQCSGSVAASGLKDSVDYVALLAKCLKQIGGEPLEVDEEGGVAESVVTVVELVKRSYEEDKESFIGNRELVAIDDRNIGTVTTVARLCEVVVRKLPHALQITHWNTLLVCLVDWIKSIKITLGRFASRKCEGEIPVPVLAFAGAVVNLHGAICGLIERLKTDTKLATENLIKNWNELFLEATCNPLWPLVLDLFRLNESTTSARIEIFVSMISKGIVAFPTEKMSTGMNEDDATITHATFRKLLPFVCSRKRANQITAYRLTKRLVPSVVAYDENNPLENGEGSESNARPLPKYFINALIQMENETKTVVGNTRPGDPLKVTSDDLHILLGYVLLWELVLDQCAAATSELRCQYAEYLQDSGLTRSFFDLLFCLIPQRVLPEKEVGGVKAASYVVDELGLDVFDSYSVAEVEHASCRVFSHALRQLPAVVRQWFTSIDKHTSGLVEKFTSRFVSALLCAEEMKAVQTANTTFTNMTIRVRPTVREVVAAYTIDDASMELIVKLPSHHPLGQIVVEGGKKVGISQSQWRNWMLQLTTFLIHQNGSIYDGLLLWKRNADKRFEGLEECYICYYILHGSSYQLPKLQCKTCKKKFHAACLYKWFNTSNNSTCPLCRNLF